jgi:hypothetical protein
MAQHGILASVHVILILENGEMGITVTCVDHAVQERNELG